MCGPEIKTEVIMVNALVTQESICKTGWKMGKEECCLSKEKSIKVLIYLEIDTVVIYLTPPWRTMNLAEMKTTGEKKQTEFVENI